jgi:hypothetical protein
METRKVDLLELSDSERDKVLKQAKSYLQQQKEEVKMYKGLTSIFLSVLAFFQ